MIETPSTRARFRVGDALTKLLSNQGCSCSDISLDKRDLEVLLVDIEELAKDVTAYSQSVTNMRIANDVMEFVKYTREGI